ncbi:CehA/McbA family metallohydrolase [Methanobacterium alcaliphilum]|uniref:CehA/McbA family metallohydrolase n=1 Tax=Methanobacterium alcaliphilum TaxID=392018 RepID=UPI00200B6087|nr:PHP domain-containing protein [Methanobacterium alcaliphilum]MCK9152370.1 PHP domain-containing protein [Methanobacterium alcaliphilum]
MIIDPHIHTIYSGDATGAPREIIERARTVGLDAIAIADHNTMKGSLIAQREVKDFKDILVIPAMEISTNKGHIVALGIYEEINKGLSPEETLELIHEMNGVAIVPHPFVRYREGLFCKIKDLKVDAIETMNSRYIFGYSNWKAKKLAIEKNIPEIGASDSHFVGAVGSCVTDVDADFSVEDILISIKSGKTTAYGDRTPLPLIIKEVINKKIKRVYEY